MSKASQTMFLARPLARADGENHLEGLEALVACLRVVQSHFSSQFYLYRGLPQSRRRHISELRDGSIIVYYFANGLKYVIVRLLYIFLTVGLSPICRIGYG